MPLDFLRALDDALDNPGSAPHLKALDDALGTGSPPLTTATTGVENPRPTPGIPRRPDLATAKTNDLARGLISHRRDLGKLISLILHHHEPCYAPQEYNLEKLADALHAAFPTDRLGLELLARSRDKSVAAHATIELDRLKPSEPTRMTNRELQDYLEGKH